MRRFTSWKTAAAVTVAGVASLSGAAQAAAPKNEPATIEEIAGSDLHRITLQARAAERLGIQTVAVKMTMVGRKRTVAAEVFAPGGEPAADGAQPPADKAGIWLRVLPIADAAKISRELPAQVLPASSRDTFEPLTAQPALPPKPEAGTLYYFVEGGAASLQPKHRVLVELPFTPALRAPVPASAMFYDAKGGTWVYELVAPLTYVRHAIRVAYVEGDTAYLDAAPADDAQIVTVGAPLLQGVEFKVGH